MSTKEAAIVFATLRPHPEKAADLEDALHTMVEHTRAEPGCEVYDLYRSGQENVVYHLFERYTDADALEAHRAAPYYKEYRAKLPDLLDSPVEVTLLSEVDVLR